MNGWIVSLDQWKPNRGHEFLNRILFWIRIRGLPIHLLKKKAVESIVEPLGKVEAVELHAKNSTSLEYVRAKTWVKADAPLQFRKVVNFATGEVIPVELEYEKLLKVCFCCKRLTHDQTKCPFQIKEQPSRRGGRQSETNVNAKSMDKGKSKYTDYDPEGVQKGNEKGSKVLSTGSSGPGPKARSARERIQWTNRGNRGAKGKTATVQQVWKQKERVGESSAKEEALKISDEIVVPASKRRRLSGSSERQPKKAKIGSAEKANPSPSVFQRLGHSGDKANSGERAENMSKGKQSPSVFDRLGSQSSGSGSKSRELANQSSHSASVAAQCSNQSATSVAVHHRNSSDPQSDGVSGFLLKEGFMINSNPSSQL